MPEWGDLKVGQVIEFRHRNRSQRLAGRTPEVRRGVIQLVWYPAERETTRRNPQIKLTVRKIERSTGGPGMRTPTVAITGSAHGVDATRMRASRTSSTDRSGAQSAHRFT